MKKAKPIALRVAELLLFFLQHPNLCHEQLVLLVGIRVRRTGRQQTDDEDSQ